MSALLHLPAGLGWRDETPAQLVPFGIPALDALLAGLPRGRITSLAGPASSGRTTLLHRVLAAQPDSYHAVVDATDAFDPKSAHQSGVCLDRLVWVKCAHRLDHALKSADLLLHAGGFGVIALDLGDVPQNQIGRIPPNYWYRFQRTVEKSSCVFLLIAEEHLAKTAAALLVDLQQGEANFHGSAPFLRLNSVRFHAGSRKPFRNQRVEMNATMNPE